MPPSATTWLIIEPTITGHHFSYLEHLTTGATKRGLRVVVGVGKNQAGAEIEQRLRDAHPEALLSFESVPAPASAEGPARLARGMLRWRRFYRDIWEAASAKHRIDFVLVPYFDYGLFAVALLGSPFGDCPFAGFTMRQRFHFPEVGVKGDLQRGAGWRRRLFCRLLAQPTLHRIFVIDDTLAEYVSRLVPGLARKLVYIPDPSEPAQPMDPRIARTALGIPSGAHVVLLYGYIEARKGIAELLQWAAGAGSAMDVRVVLAGRIDRDARDAVNGADANRLRAKDRLHVLDRYITAQEEQWLFSAADWVWLAYDRFELMSGVLVKAAQHHRGILYRDVGLIGRFARRYGARAEPRVRDDGPSLLLPPGIELRSFEQSAVPSHPMPDHTWEHACRIVFGGAVG